MTGKDAEAAAPECPQSRSLGSGQTTLAACERQAAHRGGVKPMAMSWGPGSDGPGGFGGPGGFDGPGGPGGPGGFGGAEGFGPLGGPPPGPSGPGWGRRYYPGGECCAGPGCCMLGLASPILAVVLPVRAVQALRPSRDTARRPRGRDDLRRPPRGAAARLLYRGVRFYQAELSQLTPHCPHSPSCSEYAAAALSRHGAARGSWLAVRRLLRCRPGTAGGSDPVPS
jgi:putative membrane protein insertion efficiency factor